MAGQEGAMCRTVWSLYFLCTLYGVWMKYECGALVEWWLGKTEKKKKKNLEKYIFIHHKSHMVW
jgi:hypothetical protein